MYACDWRKWEAGHQEGRNNLSEDKEVGNHEALEEQIIKETQVIPLKTVGSVLILRRCIGIIFHSPIMEGFKLQMVCRCVIP